MPETTSFYFLRHGQTSYNKDGKYAGRTDISLNQEGVAQAKKAARILAPYDIEKIVYSPMKRTHQTAKIVLDTILDEVAGCHSVVTTPDTRLIERCFGTLEGKMISKYRDLLKTDISIAGETYETNKDIAARALPCFLEPQEETTLYVSHGGVFRSLLDELFGRSFRSQNCEPFFFKCIDGQWQITRLESKEKINV